MWMCVLNATSELTFYYVNVLEACMYKCTIGMYVQMYSKYNSVCIHATFSLFKFFVLSTASL